MQKENVNTLSRFFFFTTTKFFSYGQSGYRRRSIKTGFFFSMHYLKLFLVCFVTLCNSLEYYFLVTGYRILKAIVELLLFLFSGIQYTHLLHFHLFCLRCLFLFQFQFVMFFIVNFSGNSKKKSELFLEIVCNDGEILLVVKQVM